MAKLCPDNRVMGYRCIWLLNRFRPVCRGDILYLISYHRSVWYCTLKGVERKNILSTESKCCIANAELWCTDFSGVCLCWWCKSHITSLKNRIQGFQDSRIPVICF